MKNVSTTLSLPLPGKEYDPAWARMLVDRLSYILNAHAVALQNAHNITTYSWSPSGTWTPAQADTYETLSNSATMSVTLEGDNSTLICIADLNCYCQTAAVSSTWRFTRGGSLIGQAYQLPLGVTDHEGFAFTAVGTGIASGAHTMLLQAKAATLSRLYMNTSNSVNVTFIELRK